MEFKYLTDTEFSELSEYKREKYLDEKRKFEAKQAQEAAEKAAEKAVESAKETFNKEVESLKEEIKVVKDEAEKTTSELESIRNENARLKEASVRAEKGGRHFEDALKEALNEQMDSIKKLSTDKRAEVKFSLKAVADMGIANISNIELANAQLGAGIHQLPNRPTHMRDIMLTGRMTTSDFHYLREVGGEGAVTTWTENSGKKPQLDFDYVEKIAPSQYIAGYVKISRKALDDVEALQSALTGRLLESYLVAEDTQILSGNGISPNLEGILEVATAYDENPLIADYLAARIIDATGQLEEGVGSLTEGFYANGILLKPRDWTSLLTATSKGTEEFFTNPGLGAISITNGNLYLAGVPVYKMNGLPTIDRQFLVGDWSRGAQLLIREDPTIAFSYENEDDFVQNKITVRVEGRVALPIYYEEAFIKGFVQRQGSN